MTPMRPAAITHMAPSSSVARRQEVATELDLQSAQRGCVPNGGLGVWLPGGGGPPARREEEGERLERHGVRTELFEPVRVHETEQPPEAGEVDHEARQQRGDERMHW